MTPRCDHKFVDSNVCVKCGWAPPGTPLALPPGPLFPLTYKVEVLREDLGMQVRFWAKLTRAQNRPAVLRALDDAMVELASLRNEVALAGVAEEDR